MGLINEFQRENDPTLTEADIIGNFEFSRRRVPSATPPPEGRGLIQPSLDPLPEAAPEIQTPETGMPGLEAPMPIDVPLDEELPIVPVGSPETYLGEPASLQLERYDPINYSIYRNSVEPFVSPQLQTPRPGNSPYDSLRPASSRQLWWQDLMQSIGIVSNTFWSGLAADFARLTGAASKALDIRLDPLATVEGIINPVSLGRNIFREFQNDFEGTRNVLAQPGRTIEAIRSGRGLREAQDFLRDTAQGIPNSPFFANDFFEQRWEGQTDVPNFVRALAGADLSFAQESVNDRGEFNPFGLLPPAGTFTTAEQLGEQNVELRDLFRNLNRLADFPTALIGEPLEALLNIGNEGERFDIPRWSEWMADRFVQLLRDPGRAGQVYLGTALDAILSPLEWTWVSPSRTATTSAGLTQTSPQRLLPAARELPELAGDPPPIARLPGNIGIPGEVPIQPIQTGIPGIAPDLIIRTPQRVETPLWSDVTTLEEGQLEIPFGVDVNRPRPDLRRPTWFDSVQIRRQILDEKLDNRTIIDNWEQRGVYLDDGIIADISRTFIDEDAVRRAVESDPILTDEVLSPEIRQQVQRRQRPTQRRLQIREIPPRQMTPEEIQRSAEQTQELESIRTEQDAIQQEIDNLPTAEELVNPFTVSESTVQIGSPEDTAILQQYIDRYETVSDLDRVRQAAEQAPVYQGRVYRASGSPLNLERFDEVTFDRASFTTSRYFAIERTQAVPYGTPGTVRTVFELDVTNGRDLRELNPLEQEVLVFDLPTLYVKSIQEIGEGQNRIRFVRLTETPPDPVLVRRRQAERLTQRRLENNRLRETRQAQNRIGGTIDYGEFIRTGRRVRRLVDVPPKIEMTDLEREFFLEDGTPISRYDFNLTPEERRIQTEVISQESADLNFDPEPGEVNPFISIDVQAQTVEEPRLLPGDSMPSVTRQELADSLDWARRQLFFISDVLRLHDQWGMTAARIADNYENLTGMPERPVLERIIQDVIDQRPEPTTSPSDPAPIDVQELTSAAERANDALEQYERVTQMPADDLIREMMGMADEPEPASEGTQFWGTRQIDGAPTADELTDDAAQARARARGLIENPQERPYAEPRVVEFQDGIPTSETQLPDATDPIDITAETVRANPTPENQERLRREIMERVRQDYEQASNEVAERIDQSLKRVERENQPRQTPADRTPPGRKTNLSPADDLRRNYFNDRRYKYGERINPPRHIDQEWRGLVYEVQGALERLAPDDLVDVIVDFVEHHRVFRQQAIRTYEQARDLMRELAARQGIESDVINELLPDISDVCNL